MEQKLTKIINRLLPHEIALFIDSATVYDSSCSPNAKVYFIDKDDGYFLKISKTGSLTRENRMTKIFSTLGIGATVIKYISEGSDYLLTSKISGEDCTHIDYLSDPKKLCDTLAVTAKFLHNQPLNAIDIPNHTDEYVCYTKKRYKNGFFDKSFTLDFKTADKAMSFFEKNRHLLKPDCLIHGDFCLPNIILSNWNFSGFIDVDHAGLGNKHIDLFWCAWSLAFNLKTNKYTDRLFDAYGRNEIDTDALKTVMAAETFN